VPGNRPAPHFSLSTTPFLDNFQLADNPGLDPGRDPIDMKIINSV
jgi:hypothetical protein